MRKDDIQYYRKRALEEQAAAQKAASQAARRCHDELAAMYRFKVCLLSDALQDWAARTSEAMTVS